jgi:hypothetical protein
MTWYKRLLCWLFGIFSWCFMGALIMTFFVLIMEWFKPIPATQTEPLQWQWTGPIHPLLLFLICSVGFFLFSKYVDYVDPHKEDENNKGEGAMIHGDSSNHHGDADGDSGGVE